jgi:hypothetical protein
MSAFLRLILHLLRNRLLAIDIQHLGHTAGTPRKLRALAPNEVPWQLKHGVQALQALARSLGQEEVYPEQPNGGHAAEEHHGAAGGHAEEHEGHGFRVAVLVDEVEGHGDGATEGTQAERVDFGVDEVLDLIISLVSLNTQHTLVIDLRNSSQAPIQSR